MKLLRFLTVGALLLLSTVSASGGIVMVGRTSDAHVFQLHGSVDHNGITSVTYDGNVILDDPSALGLGLDAPLYFPFDDLSRFDTIHPFELLEVKSGSTVLAVGICCSAFDWTPPTQMLIDGELVDPPSNILSSEPRYATVGQQLSIRSEATEGFNTPGTATFFHTLFRIDGDLFEYVDGFDVAVANPGVTTTDIAVFDTPGEYWLTSIEGGTTLEFGERIIVVPEPGGIGLLFGLLVCLAGGRRSLRRVQEQQ